jgi:hypothetical protein
MARIRQHVKLTAWVAKGRTATAFHHAADVVQGQKSRAFLHNRRIA